VTLEDARAAAARLFHPEAMRVVAVGKPQGLTATG
jgi:predicted Zn-dependent peptidase